MLTHRRGMLQEGWFGWCGRNGMALTEGLFWARRSGGYNFYYSGEGLGQIDFSHPVAACRPGVYETQISGIFEANKDYWLAVKTISGFGLESEEYEWLRIRTDSNNDGKEVPQQVNNLRSGVVFETGRVKLEWDYQPGAGRVRPAVFKIYILSGDGPDYEYWLEGQVEYREGQLRYVWESNNLSSYYPYRMVVRAETADGVDDGNGRYVIAKAETIRPGSVESVDAEIVS